MAALAYLKKDMEILHHEEMESEVMRVAARNGFIDMSRLAAAGHRRFQHPDERGHRQFDAPVHGLRGAVLPQLGSLVRPSAGKAFFD